jgi:hypothetical protein
VSGCRDLEVAGAFAVAPARRPTLPANVSTKLGVVADFDLFEWTDRDVTLVPDTNIAGNRSVQAANQALASELIRRGARVRTAILPSQQGVNGPDDFIASHSDTELFALLDSARPGAFQTTRQRPTRPKQGRCACDCT